MSQTDPVSTAACSCLALWQGVLFLRKYNICAESHGGGNRTSLSG